MQHEEAESSMSTRRGEPGEGSLHSSIYRTSAKYPPPYGAQHRQDALWEGGNEALPPMWQQYKTSSDSEIQYQDNTLMIFSWNRPLPGVRLDGLGYLAVPGWEWHISPLGRSYFINHNTRTTSWKKPKPERPAGSLMPECVIEGHSRNIWSLAYLGTSDNIMSVSDDRAIRQWKRDGEPVGKPLNSDGGGIGSMVVSPDETTVICGSKDGRLRLWNKKEGSMIGDPWEGHSAAVRCLDWSRSSLEIASGSEDGTIRRWNPDTGQQIAPPIETSHGWVNAVKYSPKGDKFMSGGNGPICIWSRDGKLLIEIKEHEKGEISLCWSKDGAHIFSASRDSTIRKWRAIDGQELVVLRGHTHPVTSLCLTPDESYIVSGSDDHSIRIWDLKTNQAVGDPLLHDDRLLALVTSPDGKYIASAGIDKKIYVWSLEAALKNSVVPHQRTEILPDSHLFMPVEYLQRFLMILTFIPPHPLVFITLLPIAFSHHLLRVHMHSLLAFRRFFTALAPTPVTNSNKPKGKGSSLIVVLVLSKLLQYGTNSLCLLLLGQNRSSSSRAANCMVRDRHRNLNLPLLRRLFQIVALRLPQQLQ